MKRVAIAFCRPSPLVTSVSRRGGRTRDTHRRTLYEIAGVWIKCPDEMGSGNALRNADFAARAARQLAQRPYRIEPLERLKAEGAITWLMPGHGESGDYLRCSEHKRPSATTEDCGRTAAG
jgi:hypothetical protein